MDEKGTKECLVCVDNLKIYTVCDIINPSEIFSTFTNYCKCRSVLAFPYAFYYSDFFTNSQNPQSRVLDSSGC